MKEEEVQKPLSTQGAGIAGNIIGRQSPSASEVESMRGFEPASEVGHVTGTALISGFEPMRAAGSPEGSRSASGSKPGSKAKLVAFSLLLVVPAVLAGCGSSSDECDPEYDEGCEYDSSSGHYYYGGYGGSSYRSGSSYREGGSSSYKSSSKSKSSGFGSFFRSSGG
ncbi:hypothetical protein DFQ00_103339 [Paenibacillus barcinonensis]|uniref:Uncharacterized protein n=2 Tax=Paenibacillus barcinonensis TaxID=198119 RepID=A0A2V4VZD9_PAEBA|nr:hypothetical protein [Paenibacillus barcinonensis]PYE50920.1 hypothetical protein DFQ00_103339 [Paenibacillus barcinonensis]